MTTYSRTVTFSALLALVSSALCLVVLGVLHILSPEFDPSWRMVSEYANGEYSWLLSVFFVLWGFSSFALAYVLQPYLASRKAKIGLALLIVGGIGEWMAAIFDIQHSLHGLASFLGIGGSLVGATIISRQLAVHKAWESRRAVFRNLVVAMWLSIVLMAGSFIVLIATYASSGADMTAASNEITTLPEGVIALVGWANRLVIVTFLAWLGAAAYFALQLHKK